MPIHNDAKMQNKMTGTLANGYSSESTWRELSNEYQHDRVWMDFKNICVLVLWTNVASALEGSMDRWSDHTIEWACNMYTTYINKNKNNELFKYE